jgi:cyclopropane fatty-acyl-phospholipid synthase-like methyltransferase
MNNDLQIHWNNAYSKNEEEKLGWYETDLSPSLKLINSSQLAKGDTILVIGAGSTNLIDDLIKDKFTSILCTDISDVALKNLSNRIGEAECLECIVDDLRKPEKLKTIEQVDLWFDRAVLHFLVEQSDQTQYFDLLRSKVKSGGHVILAEFSLEGATKCSGLPIVNYSSDMLQERLGDEFTLIEEFNYVYTMPSGDKRPYIYTLFKRK